MAGITQDQRMRTWNVQIIGGVRIVAGFYQRDSFLTVADVACELEMCLQFPQPEGAWRAILLPMETTLMSSRAPPPAGEPSGAEPALTIDSEPFVLLDNKDYRRFPTPAVGYRARYRYALHAASCNNPRHSEPTGMLLAQTTPPFSHPFPYADTCIIEPGTPSRRRDPRYLPIGKRSTDERFRLIRGRRSAKRRASSSSSSRTPSKAPGSSMATNDVDVDLGSADIPTEIIPADQAEYIMSKFRTNVLTGGVTCAITGKGESWLGNSIGGPGIEVAHIVPQCHWNTYPIKTDQGVADREARPELEAAWRCTWASSNGLPLLSHLHKCLEARLIAIHPTTHHIRTFAWYDILNDYHGQKAEIPPDVDPNALQHQWDMCCLENIVAAGIPNVPVVSSPPIVPPIQSPRDTSSTMPQGPDRPPTSGPGHDSASHTITGQPTSGTNNQHRLSSVTAHPPSPPSSDTVGQWTKWKVGNEVIEDPRYADRLRHKGWDVKELRAPSDVVQLEQGWQVGNEVIEDPSYAERLRKNGWNVRELRGSGRPRTRPRKRHRSVSRWRVGSHVIEDEYEAQRLRVQGWIVEHVRGEEDGPADVGRPSKRPSSLPDAAKRVPSTVVDS